MPKGQLIVIYGLMFSSKTSYLLGRLSSYCAIKKKVIYVSSDIDTRSTITFSTHNAMLTDVEIPDITYKKIHSFTNETLLALQNYDVIGIDEAQFFDSSLQAVRSLVAMRKIVLIAGLLVDVKDQVFGYTLSMIPFANEAIPLRGYCHKCAEKGEVTQAVVCRKIQVDGGAIIDVGASDKYIILCSDCDAN